MTQALRSPLDVLQELLGEDLSPRPRVPPVGLSVAPAESTGYDFGQTAAPALPRRSPLDVLQELLGEEPVAPSRGVAYPILYPQVEPPRELRPYEAPARPSVTGPATFEPSGEGGIEVGRYDPNSLLTKAGARFSYALEDANLNDSAFLASVNPLSTPDDWQEIARRDRDLERRRRATPARSETSGLMGQVENAILSAVEISGPMARGLLEGGIVGAGGAMVAAPTGPGAVVSGALTATAGAAQYWVRQGAGSMARAMHREGVPQDIAAPIAVGLGLPYALIEQSQVGKIVRGFDKKAARSLGGAASRAVARVVKQYGLEAGQEVGEEVAQELVAISAEEGAKALSNAMRGTELEGGSWSELATRLKDTATGVGPGLAVLLLPGTAARALYGVNYEAERTRAVGAFQRSIADLSPEQQQAVIAMLPPEGQQAVAGRVIAEAPTIPQRPADSPLEQEEKAALIHDIAAIGAKPTQWLRDNVGKTFDKLTYYDLDLARRVLATPEEGGVRGQERVEVPPEAQPVGEALAEEAAEAPPAVEMPSPAVSTPERAGEREAAKAEEQKAARPAAIPEPVESPVAPAEAREPAPAPKVAPEAEAAPAPAPAARPVVTERPSYLELAYPDGSRGPEEDQKRLRAAKARFWKDKGVWRMATKGAGLTEEIVARRRGLVQELAGAAEQETKAARPETSFRGDRAEYTGNTREVSGQTFYEIELMEGAEQGKLRVVAAPPGGESLSVERNWREYREQQAEFRRLREEPAVAPQVATFKAVATAPAVAAETPPAPEIQSGIQSQRIVPDRSVVKANRQYQYSQAQERAKLLWETMVSMSEDEVRDRLVQVQKTVDDLNASPEITDVDAARRDALQKYVLDRFAQKTEPVPEAAVPVGVMSAEPAPAPEVAPEAEAAPAAVPARPTITDEGNYLKLTFAERPPKEVIQRLHAAKARSRQNGLEWRLAVRAQGKDLPAEMVAPRRALAQELAGTAEQETKAARPATSFRGDRAEYTGGTREVSGQTFYEIEIMEGAEQGKMRVVAAPPGGESPSVERNRQERRDQQAEFRKLKAAPEPVEPVVSEAVLAREPWEMTREELIQRYQPGNPFAARAAASRDTYNQLIRPTNREKALESAFPLGAGHGRKGGAKRVDATIDKAVRAGEARKQAEWHEAQALAFDRGEINTQGRRPAANAEAAKESREALQARAEAAQAEREGKEPWEVRGAVLADASRHFAGSARQLVLSDHRQAVADALAANKPVPTAVLADYPDLRAEQGPASESPAEAAPAPETEPAPTELTDKDIGAPLGIRRLQGKVQPESGEERSTILASGFNPLDALKSPGRLAQMAAEELTPKPSPHAFDTLLGEEFTEIEERMQGARGLGRVPVGERLEEGFSHFAALWTREWEHLPRGAEFARLRDALNKLKKQKGVASYKTLEAMQDAVEGLDEGQTDLFRRKVILDDLAYEVEQKHPLPFGFTPETLERARKAVDMAVAQDEQVTKAIDRRKQAWDNLKSTYVRAMKDIGFNADFILKNPNYFRHQVLEYARARRGGAPQGVGTLHTPSGRGMLRRREGSELDINSDYLEAEYEAMSQMFYDVEVARTIKVVDEEHNMLPDLKTQAKSHNYSAMLKALAPIAEERTAQLTPRQIEKRVEAGKPEYVTPEEVYRQMLNWKQAKGFSELGKMAADGMLPNNGQWDDVIEGLAAQYIEGVQEAEAEAIGTSLVGRPDFDMPDTGEILAYAGWLLKAHPGEPGSGAAALIFKGMSEKKQTVRKMLSEIGQFRTWEDFVPKGAVIWQPREGQVFFMADTVPARLVEKALEEGLEELGVPLAALRKAMVMGTPRRQYVLDERVALTLENFTQVPGPWQKLFRLPLNLWKQSVLLGPHKLVRYNIRNLTGDADAAYVGNPSTFQALPRAITNLAGPILKGRKITGEVREWFERGGFGSSLSVQELEEVGDLRIWRDKFPKQDHNAFEALARGVKNKTWRAYWKAARISTDYREALLRYAAYLDYLGQMEKNGGVPNNWGASIREEVMALPDIRDRAFKLSNDLLGAYDEVSVAGQGLRRYAYPFWSWNEVNFRRYKRLMQNAYQDGKLMQAIGRKAMAKYGIVKEAPEGFRGAYIAANVGRFVFRALTVWGVFEAWNRLLFPDDDDRLPEEVKGRPHLTFGEDEDGKIRYFSRIGALGDFLEWFGLDAAPTDVRDFVNGKRTLGEIVKDMALSPVEKVIHGASPYFKTPAELITRKQLFPDPWRPRTIRDRGLYLAQLIGLEKEYAWATDLPSKDASEAVPDLFMYRADPGQAAYSDLYEEKRRYLKTLGLEREGFVWSDRSNALYNARLATRYKDEDGQRKYMLEYFRLGGTMQGMRQSFAMMHPLQGIPKKQQAAFVDGLDNEDRLKLARAIDFYDRVLLGDGGPDRILYGNIGEVRPYLEPDEVRQELARLAADATLARAGSEPDRRLVKLSRAEGGWKSYKARLDKKDRARLETAIHNHLTDRLQEMARLRAKVEVLTGAERKDAMEDLNRLTKPYGGWPEIYRRFGLRAYPGAEKGVAHWYHEYAQELRQERQAAAR